MNQILIYVVTAVGMLLFAFSIENKKIPVNHFSEAVFLSYQNLLKTAGRTGVILSKTAIMTAIALLAFASYLKSLSLIGNTSPYKTLVLAFTIFVLLTVILFYLFGIPLLLFSKVEKLMKSVHKRMLSMRFLITAYILFAYFLLLWCAPNAMKSCGYIVLVGLLISYILNMGMLVNISVEPLTCCYCRYGGRKGIEQRHPLKIVLAGALVLILLIVLNLYLAVVMISLLYEPAYYLAETTKPASSLDLLYYTVISFTTIGYGDIVPIRMESKIMAMVIAFTSVMCLVIFVSSILALKEKLSGENL